MSKTGCTSASATVNITSVAEPIANAGINQDVCEDQTILSATISNGSGVWSSSDPGISFDNPTQVNTVVRGLTIGGNTLTWTVSNASCPDAVSTVIITRETPPTISDAGTDQVVCSDVSTLDANTPTVGTGVWNVVSGSGTVDILNDPNSAVSGLSLGENIFRWTISNGSCPVSTSTIKITRVEEPTTADAGPNETICAATSILNANTPSIGTGVWTIVAGSSVVDNPNDPNSGVSNLSVGANVLRWTISNGTCPVSTSTVTITRDETPTSSNAGLSQTVCVTMTTLNATPPTVGTGTWSVIAGSATLIDPSDPNTTVMNLSAGLNTFRWTVSNGSCPTSVSNVNITREELPTTANAGTNQTICTDNIILSANTPTVGVGSWTLVSGSGDIDDINDPNTIITSLGVGVNIFRWTISNGSCTASTDDITITRQDAPTTANAGVDQTVCSTSTTLSANTSTVGTGQWTVVSGTGSFSDINSPTSTVSNLSAGTNIFRWTISNGSCTSSADEVTIVSDEMPSTALAGGDQNICTNTTTLGGNTPTIGTGVWTLVSGSATINDPVNPNTTITDLGVGVNTFRWTISNGSCTPSTDEVNLTRSEEPTTSNAGSDQTICSTTTTLNANSPTIGTGAWTVLSGTGVFSDPTDPQTTVTNLATGLNTFRWTIANGSCTASSDEVSITSQEIPTVSNAGTDQNICSNTTTLNANTATIGTGTWTVISGSGIFSNANSPNTTVSNLSAGANIFRWTISNGTCPITSDEVTITSDELPTTANAGVDQTVCGATVTLNANTAITGTGTWTVLSGTGVLTNPNDPLTTISNLSAGANIFRWTISNGTCTSTSDEVTITSDELPTSSIAGTNQTICATTATLSGNVPSAGTGTWTVVSGTAVISSPNSATTAVTNLSVGDNIFEWTISNGICSNSSSFVTISREEEVSTALAGGNQTLCTTSTTLNANLPTVGTGTWILASGTGTISDPSNPGTTVSDLGLGTNIFRWTISNGTCPTSSDEVSIIREENPSTANAGTNETICSTNTTLNANTPTVGVGTWTLISGAGDFTNANDPQTSVNNLGVGTNIFRWTISNGTCPTSTDEVTVTREELPSTANAGTNQTVCTDNITLSANTQTVGVGNWTLVSGSGDIDQSNNPNTAVSNLGVGANVFRWTVSNGTCTASTDEVTITREDAPTVSFAGVDQIICANTATLSANTPASGTGQWMVVSGSGSFSDPNSPSTTATNLGVGANTFSWTITNGTCTNSSSTVTITREELPTTAMAGGDQTICTNTSTLNANTPTIGTGSWILVSGNATISSPNSSSTSVSDLGVGANIFRWTISNGTCMASMDEITITREAEPSISVAGPNQTVCSTSTNLVANTPTTGSGMWTVITGTATINDPTSPTTTITNLSPGINTFNWTITNGTCTTSTSSVTITRNEEVSTALAGGDQNICSESTSLSANTPGTGTGIWTLIAGSATIADPSNPNTTVSNLGTGINTFRWTITNGNCPNSTDEVTITREQEPTTSDAGVDQTICSNSAILNANTPVVGTGVWKVLSGSAIIVDPSSPTTQVNNLSMGDNIFEWTISNGTCTNSSSTITISQDELPITSNAGINQDICLTTTVLNGNNPGSGLGIWTVASGTGVVANPNSPNTSVSNLSQGTNTFVWTISNGSCPPSVSSVDVNRDSEPSTAIAGSPQTICATTAILNANTPTVGSGTWTVISGTGTVLDINDPRSSVSGLSVGDNTLRWTVSNGTCINSSTTVTITRNEDPTIANAGADQNICSDNTTLNGNTPLVGTGVWTRTSGSGILSDPSSPNSNVTNLSVGVNTFVWTISNGTCTNSNATVTITREEPPTTADAGTDQTICSTSFNLNANTPTVGTGTWTVINGSGVITNPNSPNTSITGLSAGLNTFRWTITNACGSSSASVNIMRDEDVQNVNAGLNQIVCTAITNLQADNPTIGTGVWTVVSGSGVLDNATDPNSGVTNLSIGNNTFRWTVSNGVCPTSSSTVSITRLAEPSIADAGADQTLCNPTTSLDANLPTSGTGLWTVVSGNGSFNDPTDPQARVSNLATGINTFRWTISNGSCTSSSSTINVIVDENPTIADAGADQTICAENVILDGNSTVIGIGTWTVIEGSAVIDDPSDPNTTVSNLSIGVNRFTWTVSNGTCTASSSTVRIIRDEEPSNAIAGTNQTTCESFITLNANAPVVGTGEWSVISGSATITNPNNPNTTVTGLSIGTNQFRWTVSNGTCMANEANVEIIREEAPTISDAGSDQEVCVSSATLNANNPLVGVGTWTVTEGSGIITNPNNPNSTVTGLSVGRNTFRWTIVNGGCSASESFVNIDREEEPTTANAGVNQTICDDNFTLNANPALLGTGTWTVIAGSATVTDPNNPNSGITSLSPGVNTFQWTISNSCGSNFSNVSITRDEEPTLSNAGANQEVCSPIATLSANVPTVGTGVWTVTAGGASVDNPTQSNSSVSNLTEGINTFVWTISNGTCNPSSSSITITRSQEPTTAEAGENQSLCNQNSTILNSNIPTVGTRCLEPD